MTSDQVSDQSSFGVSPWDPFEALEKCDEQDILFSRGFLRCKPEKWFPGLQAHWLPFAHTFDRELQIIGIEPTMNIPDIHGKVFTLYVQDKPVSLYIDTTQKEVLLETLLPKSYQAAKDVCAEYLARRFLVSIARSWSGSDVGQIKLDMIDQETARSAVGGIRIRMKTSNVECSLWLLLQKEHVELLDGMWRRQTSSFRQIAGPSDLRLQIAELAVPLSLLSDYTQTGAIIDLETPEQRTAVLLRGEEPWQKVEMLRHEQVYALRVTDAARIPAALPPGTTRLSIELGHFESEPGQLAELSQPGAMIKTPLALSGDVEMKVHGDVVARGRLGLYEGRFAVTTL